MFDSDTLRLATAGALTLGYTGGCAWQAWRFRRRPPTVSADGWLVAHASHSGQAQALAAAAADALRRGGQAAVLMPLGDLDLATLRRSRRLLLVASTHGEGQAPDAALDFELHCMKAPVAGALQGLQFGLLALGDRQYRHFCAFGRRLDAWLQAAGAQPLFERIDADGLGPQVLARWQAAVTALGGVSTPGPALALPFEPWRVRSSRWLNAGSSAAPLVALDLEPPAGRPLPEWQAGDLAEVDPGDGSPPRSYSLASLPQEGVLRLVVRRRLLADGRPGLVSGRLTTPDLGTVPLRLRPHEGFRIGANVSRPLLLVGAGSGWSGLRAHLAARAQRAAPPVWLLFGERSPAHDGWVAQEVDPWRRSGLLAHADFAWSRDGGDSRHVQDGGDSRNMTDGGHARHVQDLLRQHAARLHDWVRDGAAIYVCGSRAGLGAGVDQALEQVLGTATVQSLRSSGRLRRDLY